MLCATPLGLCGRGYKSIILLIWNPYGVLRDIETQNIASLRGGDGVPFAKKSHIDSTLVVRLGAWSSKKESATPYLLALQIILVCLFMFSGHQ